MLLRVAALGMVTVTADVALTPMFTEPKLVCAAAGCEKIANPSRDTNREPDSERCVFIVLFSMGTARTPKACKKALAFTLLPIGLYF